MKAQFKFGTIASALVLSATMQANAATEIYENYNNYDRPDGTAMVMDTTIAKPLQTVMVAGGAVVWAASLPFSLIAGNAGESFQVLVAEPADNLRRCLGCTDLQDQNRIIYNYQQEQKRAMMQPEESTNSDDSIFDQLP